VRSIALVVVGLLVAFGPHFALQVYEMKRWRRETRRDGGWLAMRLDGEYQRAARRSGRAYLVIPALLWFLCCFVILSFLLDTL
jgi:hypothetical protein